MLRRSDENCFDRARTCRVTAVTWKNGLCVCTFAELSLLGGGGGTRS